MVKSVKLTLNKLLVFVLLFFVFCSFAICNTNAATPRTVQIKKVGNTQVIHLRKGKPEQLKKDSRIKKYKSSDSKIVGITKNGVLKGKKPGTVTVRTYDKKGKILNTYKVKVFDTSATAVRNRILKMKKKYPHKSRWDVYYPYSPTKPYTANYRIKGTVEYCGLYVACEAFANRVSDYAYGYIRGSLYKNPNKIAVGDIITLHKCVLLKGKYFIGFGEGHQAIVWKISGNKYYIAQGNCDGKVDWNMYLTKSELKKYFKSGITKN